MNREEALEILDTIPTIHEQVDALEMAIEALENQKTGHWIEGQRNSLEIHNILCSNCLGGYSSKGHANSQYTREKFKFCPSCGAKMEGE